MRRRELLGFALSATALPVVARAQQSTLPVVGFLSPGSPADVDRGMVGIRLGLADVGFVEGRNVSIQTSAAHGKIDQLLAQATALASRPVSVIIALSTAATQACKAATTSVPVVFVTGDDPVASGLVASLNKPEGNITGISFVSASLASKRLQLLRSLVPSADLIGFLADKSPESQNQLADAQAAAKLLGQPFVVRVATSEAEVDASLGDFTQHRVRAVLINGGPFLYNQAPKLVAWADRAAVPAMYPFRDFAPGTLVSYGASLTDSMRQGAVYAGRILRGEKPANLPVLQPTKFELVINARTAKALKIELSPMLLALADEVIE